MLLIIRSQIWLVKWWIYDNLLHLDIITSWIDSHAKLVIELSFEMSSRISLIVDYYLCVKWSKWVIMFKIISMSSSRSIILYATVISIKHHLALQNCRISWSYIWIASLIREWWNFLRTLVKVVFMISISRITCCGCLDISLREETMSHILWETLSKQIFINKNVICKPFLNT